jgi:hypothetical protein
VAQKRTRVGLSTRGLVRRARARDLTARLNFISLVLESTREFTMKTNSRDGPVELIHVFMLIPIFLRAASGIKSSMERK